MTQADPSVTRSEPANRSERTEPPTERPPSPLAALTHDAVVVMDRVTMRFDDEVAVANMSLTVLPGSILGVIGPSGAGKTTTVRLLTGALEPTEGTVEVLGENPRRFRLATRERIGYMPQQFTLYPDLSARENVDFVASLFGMLWPRRRRRVPEVLRLVELWDVRGRRAADLSGGMQRRLELASALVHDPALLFLDEPTAGIDPILRARIWEELHRLRDAGRTLLVTTQYITEAEQCDAVALIANGQLIALASPDELRRGAVGGDLIEVETETTFDATRLAELDFVHGLIQTGPRTFRVIVDDVGAATPLLADAIADLDQTVVDQREHRPSFDEVFTTLVERDEQARAAAEEEERGDAAPNEAA